MTPCSIKCSYNNFEYFLLQINDVADINHAVTKLANLKKLDNSLDIPVVIAFNESLTHEEISRIIPELIKIIKDNRFIIHSIMHTSNIHDVSVSGIPVIELHHQKKKLSLEEVNKTLIINDPIRGGMQVKNDGDIIITNFVSNNAEVIANGNIHVYGLAKGRLIAGNSGDKSARIFVNQFDPEIISIGGIYKVMDKTLPESILNKQVMVYLDDKNHLNVTPLCSS